jgi:hypothetical protein
MRQRRHHPIPKQGKRLKQVLTGFLAYYAIPTNGQTPSAFRYRIIDLWRRSLHRRSQKDRTNWERITKLVNDYLPRGPNPPSLAPGSLRHHAPEVGAECPNRARSDLCGERSVVDVPTAIHGNADLVCGTASLPRGGELLRQAVQHAEYGFNAVAREECQRRCPE